MDNNDFLIAWHASLTESLQITEKNIAKIESTKKENLKHAEVQSTLIKKWLQDEILQLEVKQDVEALLKRINHRDEEAQEELDHLKIVKASTKFMIEKLKEELS